MPDAMSTAEHFIMVAVICASLVVMVFLLFLAAHQSDRPRLPADHSPAPSDRAHQPSDRDLQSSDRDFQSSDRDLQPLDCGRICRILIDVHDSRHWIARCVDRPAEEAFVGAPASPAAPARVETVHSS